MVPNASRVSFHAVTRLYGIIEIYIWGIVANVRLSASIRLQNLTCVFPSSSVVLCYTHKRKSQTLLDTLDFKSWVVYWSWERGRGLRILGAR